MSDQRYWQTSLIHFLQIPVHRPTSSSHPVEYINFSNIRSTSSHTFVPSWPSVQNNIESDQNIDSTRLKVSKVHQSFLASSDLESKVARKTCSEGGIRGIWTATGNRINNKRVPDKRKRVSAHLSARAPISQSPPLSSLSSWKHTCKRTHARVRLAKAGCSRGEVYTLMDRARSFATIGRALYMAHGAPRFPISVKVEERSRSPSERELCALQMDFTVSTKEEQRGAQSVHRPAGYNVSFTS